MHGDSGVFRVGAVAGRVSTPPSLGAGGVVERFWYAVSSDSERLGPSVDRYGAGTGREDA